MMFKFPNKIPACRNLGVIWLGGFFVSGYWATEETAQAWAYQLLANRYDKLLPVR